MTEQGGLFSHTAILARELGLPAVVGIPDLFEGVHDGDLIEVDPTTGAVPRRPTRRRSAAVTRAWPESGGARTSPGPAPPPAPASRVR
ncbi:MAG: PEP-utilizing enzyme [Acidimicrobiia bacterium]